MMSSRAEARPRMTGRAPSGRCAAQTVQARISVNNLSSDFWLIDDATRYVTVSTEQRPIALRPPFAQLDHQPERRQCRETVVPCGLLDALGSTVFAHQIGGIGQAVLVDELEGRALLRVELAERRRIGDRAVT